MIARNFDWENNWKAPFLTIWIGQAFSLLGSQLVQFALIWWLTRTTGSATVLATATLAGMLPQIIIGPFAGALVDRWNRRRVMIAADTLIALSTVGLAALFLTGQVQIWHVYAIMFIRSALGGFHWPAMQASTSLMVPKQHLARIQGANQMVGGLMNIGAAPLGALLIGFLPMQAVLMVDVVTAALAVGPLLFILIPQPAQTDILLPNERPSVLDDLKAGFRYVWGWTGLMIIGGMATLINLLLTPAGALQPILVTHVFSGGAMQLAWLESAFGLGIVAGGLTLSAWGGFKNKMVTTLVGLILTGAALGAIGFLPASAYLWAVALIFISGFAIPIVNGPVLAVIQTVVAPDMQGRVFSLINSAATAMSPLGLVIAGPLADRFGVQAWYIVGGAATLLLGVAGFFIPAALKVEQGRPVAAEAAPAPSPVAAD
jgi:DHA3 family macrolide efflux protein-like MFS transporter